MCKDRTPLPQLSHVLSLLNNILTWGVTYQYLKTNQNQPWLVPSDAFKWETELDCSNITFERNISIAVFPLLDCGAIPQERKKQTGLVYTEKSLWMFLLKHINSIWNNTEHISCTDMTMDNKGKSQRIRDVFYGTRSAEMGNNYPMAKNFPVWKELLMVQNIKTMPEQTHRE